MTKIDLRRIHQLWLQIVFEKLDFYLRSILTCYRKWYFRKRCCRLEEKRLDNSVWCFVFRLFKYWYNVCFSQASRNILHFTQFLNITKKYNYSVVGYFHHVNSNHIMTMSFIRINLQVTFLISSFVNSMFDRHHGDIRAGTDR